MSSRGDWTCIVMNTFLACWSRHELAVKRPWPPSGGVPSGGTPLVLSNKPCLWSFVTYLEEGRRKRRDHKKEKSVSLSAVSPLDWIDGNIESTLERFNDVYFLFLLPLFSFGWWDENLPTDNSILENGQDRELGGQQKSSLLQENSAVISLPIV